MRQRREEEEQDSILYHKQPINQKSFEFSFETPNKSRFTPTPLEQYETRVIPSMGIWLDLDCNLDNEKRLQEWSKSHLVALIGKS